MQGVEVLDNLCLLNRGYQVLYALGQTPESVCCLTPGEAVNLVRYAQEVIDGDRSSSIHRALAAKASPGLLRYAATGKIGR